MKMADLTRLLDHLRQIYAAAGAKGPATDIKTFSDVLGPYANVVVDQFVSSVKRGLGKEPTAGKSGGRKRASPAMKPLPDSAAIGEHVELLRAAGTERSAFDQAFAGLKAAKTLSAAEVAEIAHQYADTVTKYKSKASAYDDISKAFVRQVRFENKLR